MKNMNGHNMVRGLAVGVLCGMLFVPLLSLAAPVIRGGDSVSVGSDQVVDGDFYGAGGTVILSGNVEGDAYLGGGTVTINAPITSDLVVLGGTVNIHAPVHDDLRAVAGEVILASEVEGDVAIVAGVLRILSTATIKGDVLFLGGELIVDGPVQGSIITYGGTTRINASVGGDVNVTADTGLTLGDRAEVLGGITYKGNTSLVRAQGAVVVGDIQESKIVVKTTSSQLYIIPLLTMLFGALSLLLFMKPKLQTLVEDTKQSYGMQGLIGLAVVLGLPFAGIVLTLSILGFFVGIILIASYVALLSITWIASGVVVGTFCMQLFTKSYSVSIISVIVGVTVFFLASFIPLVGPFIILATFLIVLGGISKRLYRALV